MTDWARGHLVRVLALDGGDPGTLEKKERPHPLHHAPFVSYPGLKYNPKTVTTPRRAHYSYTHIAAVRRLTGKNLTWQIQL